jgi:hypothetical protein
LNSSLAPTKYVARNNKISPWRMSRAMLKKMIWKISSITARLLGVLWSKKMTRRSRAIVPRMKHKSSTLSPWSKCSERPQRNFSHVRNKSWIVTKHKSIMMLRSVSARALRKNFAIRRSGATARRTGWNCMHAFGGHGRRRPLPDAMRPHTLTNERKIG